MDAAHDTGCIGRIDTAHGTRWAAWTEAGLVAVGASSAGVEALARRAGLTHLHRDHGGPAPTMPDWGRLPGGFRGAALRACAEIPAGQVATYAQIARAAGSPGAARAVGSAMAANPVPVVIPCHRVVRSDGRLGEYAMGGTATKGRMLRAEGIDVINGCIG
jgi:O-6-methylguanine DNA methyltransferase